MIAGLTNIVQVNGNTIEAINLLGDTTIKQYDTALGSAAVGGLIAGPIGAVVGAAYSTRDRAGLIVEIRFRDGRIVTAAVSGTEHHTLLKAIAPRPISRLETALIWKDATPVTAAYGHQMLYGFIWQQKHRRQPALQFRLWDNRVEWDDVADKNARRPTLSISGIPLARVDHLEAQLTEQSQGILSIHARGRRYDFPGPSHQIAMTTKVYRMLLDELQGIDPGP